MNIHKKLNQIFSSVYSIGLVIIVFLPLVFCVINSFRTTSDLLRGFLVLPQEVTIDNYTYLITNRNIFQYMINSLCITLSGLLLSFLFNPFIAYMISINWDKKGFRLLYYILSSCMFIPANLLLFPLIKMYYSLNLMNVGGLILYYSVVFIPETVFMLVPYFRTFNKELGNAAKLDGCTSLQMYYRVFLPSCKSFIVTIMILNTIWLWNDFLMPLMILNKNPDTWTLPIFIYNFLGRNSFKKNYAFASCQIALMPIILFYGVFHKKIISGLNMKK